MEIKRAFMIKSIRRSEVRRRVINYLCGISPHFSYISEISRNINCSPTNVIGAIRGMGGRYKESSSLLELGIIQEDKKNKLYAITDLGRDLFKEVLA